MNIDNINFLLLLVGGIAGASFSALLTWLLSVRRLPTSHRVAIIGFPQSGKTTLITALFGYLFRRGILGMSVLPRGDETIRRVNANLEMLELRRPIPATTDQDVFAYRAEVTAGSVFLPRHYKLEIGDFPGETTIAFTEQYGDWLHETPYFRWAMAADAFLFVVDVGSVLGDQSDEYVARQKRAFRAAWQRLREHYLEGPEDLGRKAVILVFTKTDLLIRQSAQDSGLPETIALNERELPVLVAPVLGRFSDLVEYFKRETRRFDTVFASVFLTINGELAGIEKLVLYLLPIVPSVFGSRDRTRRAPEDSAA